MQTTERLEKLRQFYCTEQGCRASDSGMPLSVAVCSSICGIEPAAVAAATRSADEIADAVRRDPEAISVEVNRGLRELPRLVVEALPATVSALIPDPWTRVVAAIGRIYRLGERLGILPSAPEILYRLVEPERGDAIEKSVQDGTINGGTARIWHRDDREEIWELIRAAESADDLREIRTLYAD